MRDACAGAPHRACADGICLMRGHEMTASTTGLALTMQVQRDPLRNRAKERGAYKAKQERFFVAEFGLLRMTPPSTFPSPVRDDTT